MPIPPQAERPGPSAPGRHAATSSERSDTLTTMGDSPDFRTPDQQPPRRWKDASDWVDTTEPQLSKEEQQELAHGRNRICKQRGCAVCAPLREARSFKKKQRKTEAQALLHEKGQPCGRTSCVQAVCVAGRNAAPAAPPPTEPLTEDRLIDELQDDPDRARRREAKRHLAGVPCGSEGCPKKDCIEGFTNERTRRHRARRPCRAEACDNPICMTG